MTYWQIAAGSGGRDYSRDFLRYGLAFVGGSQPIEAMRHVALGDRVILVILKRGLGHILGNSSAVNRGLSGSHSRPDAR